MTESVAGNRQKRIASGLLLAGVVALALGLRLWGVGFGLPYAYHVDEPTYVSAALNLGAGIIGRQPNPTGLINILFGEYAGYFVAGRIAGLFASASDFERAYRVDPTIFLLLGRLTSVILGTLTVLVAYGLGKASAGRPAGWLAALFMAVAFLHVRDSHYGVPDVAVVFFLSLSVLCCVLAVQRSSRWFLWLASATGGFALATKWSIWPLLATLVLAAGFRLAQKRARAAEILIALLFFAGGFAVGGFQLLLKPDIYLEYALREQQAGAGGGFGAWQVDTVTGWVFYLKTLSYGLGIVLLVLAMLGGTRRLVQVIRTRDRVSLVLLSFPILYLLIMGASRHYFARYALPLIPFAALFAAEAVVDLTARLNARRAGFGVGLAAILIVIASAEPLARDVIHDRILAHTDTRTVAKNWIEANIPEGSKIAVDWPMHGPALSTSERTMPFSSRVYDVTTVGGTGLSDHPVQWYKDEGFEYLIASSFIYDLSLVDQDWDAKRRSFYASLDEGLTLVEEFRPYTGDTEPPFVFDEIYGPVVSLWGRDRPGPVLKIYKLGSP
jgi:hypothetical protein